MVCYASAARDLRREMAGSADATSLPAPKNQGTEALTNAAKIFREIAGDVESGLKDAEAAHYGRAADAANASIAEIKPIAETAAKTCDDVKGKLEQQASSQNNTFKALPQEGETLSNGQPVQMHPPEKNWADNHGLGWTWWGSDYEAKQEHYRATNAEANQVMGAYSSQTDGVTGSTPTFKPQDSGPAPGPAPATYGQSAGGAMAGSSYSSAPSMGGGGAPSGTSSAWAGSPSGGGGYAPAASGSGAQVPAGTGSAWANSPSGGGGLPPGVVRGPDGTLWKQGPNGQWLRQNPYNGRWAPAPQGPPGGGAGSGRGGGAAAGRGGGAAGGGAGGRAGSGFGPRGSGAGNPLAAGGRSGGGFGPSGSGSPSSTYASNSSSGGRGGMRGMGGAGGQQQGGDEEEHERPSWLVENEDVFTNDMDRVAPPVLGALPDEQQER